MQSRLLKKIPTKFGDQFTKTAFEQLETFVNVSYFENREEINYICDSLNIELDETSPILFTIKPPNRHYRLNFHTRCILTDPLTGTAQPFTVVLRFIQKMGSPFKYCVTEEQAMTYVAAHWKIIDITIDNTDSTHYNGAMLEHIGGRVWQYHKELIYTFKCQILNAMEV